MKVVKINELFSFLPKSKIKAGEGSNVGIYPFFTSSSIQKRFYDKALFSGESLIFGTGGKPSIHYHKGNFSTSADCLVLISHSDLILPKYVYYYLLGNMNVIEKGFKGAGIKHISREYVENIKIPVKSIDEQLLLISVLDKAYSIISQKERMNILCDSFLKATFLEMFQTKYLLNKKVKRIPLGNLAEVVSGITKGRKTTQKNLIDVSYLRVANVQDGYFDLSEIKSIKAAQTEIEKYKIEVGDIFLTEGGDADKLGRGAVWKESNSTFIYQNHLFRVRVNAEKLLPDFLSYLIGSKYGKSYFAKAAKQTTGIASINSKQIKEFPIPDVDFNDQLSFKNLAEFINKIKIDSLIAFQQQNLFFQVLLQNAFQGNLKIDNSFIFDHSAGNKPTENLKLSKLQIKSLLDRLSGQDFQTRKAYEESYELLFDLLNSNSSIEQVFDEKNKKIKIDLLA